jgi:hypothetical protein
MEDGLDKKGDNKDFEEKLAEQLFADENTQKIQVCTWGLRGLTGDFNVQLCCLVAF